MNQQLISTIASGVVIALAGSILIWWLSGRLKSGLLRKLIRFAALPALLIGTTAAGFVMARSSSELVPATTPILVVAENMKVENGMLTQTLNSTGALTASDTKTLSFGASAPVTKLLVSVGDTVKTGETLAQMDTTDIDAQIRDAQLNLAAAQASLDALKAPASDLDVKSAELSIQSAQASLSAASQSGSSDADIQIAQMQEELAKNSLWQAQLSRDISSNSARPNQMNAYSNQVATDASLAAAETNVQIQAASTDATLNNGADGSQLSSANAQLMSAQANFNTLLAGSTDTQIRQAEINVETAQISLDAVQKTRSDAILIAPFDGVVVAVDFAVGEIPGTSGGITLIDTSHYTITLSVDEKDIPQLAVGQSVNVTVMALDNAQLSGTVTHIDLTPSSTSNLVTYAVEVSLDTSDADVRPGMTSVANVILKQISNVIVVPNRFITTDAVTSQSTVKVETAAGVYTDVPVQLGDTTDSESVITSGLKVGQTLVILSSGNSGSNTTEGSDLGLLGGLAGGAPPGGGGGGARPGGRGG